MSKYCIIFIGEIDDSFQLDTVKLNFKRYFKLTEIQTKYLFSGKEITLKKNLIQEEALQFAVQIDKMGGVSYIDTMAPGMELPEGITRDRRIKERRHVRFTRRAKTRAGIGADRRIHQEQRKAIK